MKNKKIIVVGHVGTGTTTLSSLPKENILDIIKSDSTMTLTNPPIFEQIKLKSISQKSDDYISTGKPGTKQYKRK
jgi:hypothetical protein